MYPIDQLRQLLDPRKLADSFIGVILNRKITASAELDAQAASVAEDEDRRPVAGACATADMAVAEGAGAGEAASTVDRAAAINHYGFFRLAAGGGDNSVQLSSYGRRKYGTFGGELPSAKMISRESFLSSRFS